MPYTFQPNRLYRMPTHFGPSLGPRQGEDGRKFTSPSSHKTITYTVSFLSDRAQLEALLPAGFRVDGEPVVTVEVSYFTEIEWLAGRGYNVCGVKFPAVFQGQRDRATGPFLTVLWENLTDPILTGREELGFSKIYCEIPEPRVYAGTTHIATSWLGFRMMDLKVWDLAPAPLPPAAEPTPAGVLRGTLHYKYIPKTGDWGAADVEHAVLTPEYTPNRVVHEVWKGAGSVQFQHATWEDLPTQCHIVNAFQALTVKEWRGATLVKSVGSKDLSDQRILR